MDKLNGVLPEGSWKTFEPLIKDLYSGAKGVVKAKIKEWLVESKISQLYKKSSSVRNVKTIWQIDKEVDLSNFYYPSKIFTNAERSSTKTINSTADFEVRKNILIEGTVGQGKSIFLRYLCAYELLQGKMLPLFIELRRLELVDGKINIKAGICKALTLLGIEGDNEILKYLANEGKLILFLDAFDEVEEDFRPTLLMQIEDLCQEFDALRFIVTSRPGSGIAQSSHFRVFRLASIQPFEIDKYIYRLSDPEKLEDAEKLIEAIRKSKTQIKRLLKTPLMITLLVITYKSLNQIPQQLAEFYEGLFETLLIRHDRSKPGYVRPRESKLSDNAIRKMFDAVCFLVRNDGLSSITEAELLKFVKTAQSLTQIECKPEAFIHDISKITCLLLKEGQRYYFIHKSISEFHAASFIKESAQAETFYRVCLEKQDFWHQELHFLSEIDLHKFTRCFVIPDIEKVAKLGGYPNSSFCEAVSSVLYDAAIQTEVDIFKNEIFYSFQGWPNSWCLQEIRHQLCAFAVEFLDKNSSFQDMALKNILSKTNHMELKTKAISFAAQLEDQRKSILDGLSRMDNVVEIFQNGPRKRLLHRGDENS